MEAVGEDGVITVEDSDSIDTYFDVVEGMQFDREYISPYFVTDPKKMEVLLEKPLILVTDQDVKSAQDLVPLLEKIVQTGKPLLLIAKDVTGEALTTLVLNKLKGTLISCAVKAPGFGDRRKAMLEDIAVLTGGTVIAEDAGMQIKDTTLDMLGTAEIVKTDNNNTTIIDGKGKPESIQGRIEQIEAQVETTDSDYDREKLEERKAKLAGGVAVIKVGAPTETELSENDVGFDVVAEEYRDMFDAGIIDPTKVTRSALQNAVSIAGMLLTTDALVAEIKEDEPAMPPMPGGMPPY